LRHEDLHNSYTSPNIIRRIISRRMKKARHLACMGANKNAYRAFMGEAEGKRSLGDLGVSGRIMQNGS
jgi:hypothetical protein